LMTLCISTHSDPDRKTIFQHKINGNTAFMEIIYNEKGYFAATNLRTFREQYREINKNEFRISARDWEKWYNSQIVVPIRGLSTDAKGKKTYRYMGFLLADSMSSEAFRKYDLESYVAILKAYADLLFVCFDKITILMSNVRQP